MNRKYFSLEKDKKVATLNIYGDITSSPWFDGGVSAANLSKQLEDMKDVNQINVYINSYGGEVAEGVAIYNALRRHKAKVKTVCDGFACSIASVIFMAGDERVMNEASMLMIHNAWTFAEGNAASLRKQADDLEKITQLSVEAYKANSSLKEEEIRALMDAETWMLPEEALANGFATSIEKTENSKASQNAKSKLFGIVKAHQEKTDDDEEPENEPDDVEQADTEEEDPEEVDTEEDPEADPEDEEVEEDPEDEEEAEPEEAETETDEIDEDDPEAEEPDTEETEETEEVETDEETEADDEEAEANKEAAQRLGRFFNAIFK